MAPWLHPMRAVAIGLLMVWLLLESPVAMALLVIPAFVWRIHVEEPMLMQIPGYSDYARLLPGLW